MTTTNNIIIYSDNLLNPEQINIGTTFYRVIEDSDDGYRQCEVFYVSEIYEDNIFELTDIENPDHIIKMPYSDFILKRFTHLDSPGRRSCIHDNNIIFDLSDIMSIDVMKHVIHLADSNISDQETKQIISNFVSDVFDAQLNCSLREYIYDDDNYEVIDDNILLNIVQQSNTNKLIRYYELFEYDAIIDLFKIKMKYFKIWSWVDGKPYLMIYTEGAPVGSILKNVSDPEIDDILSLFGKTDLIN